MYYYLSVLLSNLTSFSENNYKYFIGYLYNDDNIKPLHIMLPKTSVSVNSYDRQSKWMYFLIEDGHLLEKYNTIWDKFSDYIKNKIDGKTFYNRKILKTKN